MVLPIPRFRTGLAAELFSKGRIFPYPNYSVVMNGNPHKRSPAVVCLNINQNQLHNTQRGDRWRLDPRIGNTNQLNNDYYANNPWDRGHMARRASAAWGSTLRDAQLASDGTFYYSNSTLQHENLNQDEWLGRDYNASDYEPDLHFLRNGRDLAYWVRVDVLFQAYFNACLILLQGSDVAASVPGGIGAPSAGLNPYRMASDAADCLGRSPMQEGFGTLGGPGHIGMLCEVAALALKAVWFQKWFVHLRFRPEVYAARIERERQASGSFNLPSTLLNSQAVQHAVAAHGNALLPMAFPEGSPMHPAYGAGHATVAGACVTILKALFDTTAPYPDPKQVAIVDGKDTLVDYNGAPLTIEGELNKLANNISLGRNIAGVHWRSDGTYSLNLGEEVAIALLKTYAYSYSEIDIGTPVFQFTRFNGQPEVIHRGDLSS